MRKKDNRKRNSILATVVISLLFFIGLLPFHVTADDPTLVSVTPSNMTVTAGQTFTLDISCIPGQPMKAYELEVSFNPALLHVNSVIEGTIFTGYTTFFNPGIINNNTGRIIDIYGLIMGSGSVSTPGTLVSLSFTAQMISGTSTINLLQVGITNDTAYVPIMVTDGTITLREFNLIISIDGSGTVTKTPNQTTYPYGTVVQLTAVANTGCIFNSWSGDLAGNTNPISITIHGNKSVTAHFTSNQCTLTITINGSGTITKSPNQPTYDYGQVVTINAVPTTGWAFSSWTGDLTGSQNPTTITMNGNKAVVAHFEDTLPPQILNIARTTSDPLDTSPTYGWVNISCTVTDNVGVSQAILQIHNPAGSWNNVSMTAGSAGTYYHRTTTAFSMAGNYSYSIRATDLYNNLTTSNDIFFFMPPNWDINIDGKCLILDLVLISNRYGQTGVDGWIREDADNNGEVQVLDLVYVSNHYSEFW
ncbi:MAG: cohesin domain-containing protein [Candidatus Thermoplasmatota archaeon]